MLNGLRSHHLTHIGTSGRVSDHSGTAADQGDGFVACHLKSLHEAQCHEMSYMKAVCSRVKSDIEYSLSVIYHFADFFFVCHLRDQSTRYQFFINLHVSLSCFLFYFLILRCRKESRKRDSPPAVGCCCNIIPYHRSAIFAERF